MGFLNRFGLGIFCIQLAFTRVFGQNNPNEPLITATGWWGYPGSGRAAIRTPSQFIPVPVSQNLMFYLDIDGVLNAWDWRQRGRAVWKSYAIPGANSTFPAVVVDTSLPQGISEDKAYLLNPADGRVYAFDASNSTMQDPIWISDFNCTMMPGSLQSQQWISPNVRAGQVVLSCGTDIMVADINTGRLHMRIKRRSIDVTMPAPFITTNTLATFRGNRIVAISTNTPGIVPWAMNLFDPNYNITSIAATNGFFATTGSMSNTVHLVSSMGDMMSDLVFALPSSKAAPGVPTLVVNVSVLARPAFDGEVMYCVITGVDLDPFEEAPPQPIWALVAVNVTDPSDPTIMWQTPTMLGQVSPQPLTVTKKLVYVTLLGVKEFRGYWKGTGNLAWWNSNFRTRWPRNWLAASTPALTYCCDHMIIGGYLSASKNTTMEGAAYLPTLLRGLLTEPEDCYCSP